MRYREIATGAAWNVAGYVIGGIVSTLYPILLLRWLGRSDYGLVSYLALLVNQSYLLNLGIGEATGQRLAAELSRGQLTEGLRTIRAGLFGIWSLSLLLSSLWLLFGVQGLGWILPLAPQEAKLLYTVRLWVPLAVWGIQTGMFLNWIPVAMGRFRWAALYALLQPFWQALFPVGILLLAPHPTPYLALQSILTGYFLYGSSLWLISAWRLRSVLLPAEPHRLFPLLQKGFWNALTGALSLPLIFTERTLIGRWISLSLMGFYSAIHYLAGKISALILKSLEPLFPVFGSVADTPRRQILRLSQVVWLMTFLSAIGGLSGWGLLTVILPHLPIRIQQAEMFLLAGSIGMLMLFLPVYPLQTFHQSRGQFRWLFWSNTAGALIQLLLTPVCVRYGLFLFPSIGMALVLMGLNAGFFLRGYSEWIWWRAWVLPSYIRLIGVWMWGTVSFLSFSEAGLSFSIGRALLIWGGAFLFYIVEGRGKLWRKKWLFLFQLRASGYELGKGTWRRLFRPARQATLNNR